MSQKWYTVSEFMTHSWMQTSAKAFLDQLKGILCIKYWSKNKTKKRRKLQGSLGQQISTAYRSTQIQIDGELFEANDA